MVAGALFSILAFGPCQEAQDLKALIEKLRSDRVEEREEAAAALVRRGKSALSALQEALRDSQAEVAARARRVIENIRLRHGSLTLVGLRDGIQFRELLVIEPAAESSLRSQWTDPYGLCYSLETEAEARSLDELVGLVLDTGPLENARADVSHADEWTFITRFGESEKRWHVRAPELLEDKRRDRIVRAMLNLRDRHLAFARIAASSPSLPEYKLKSWPDRAMPSLLIPQKAASKAKGLTEPAGGVPPRPYEVLLAGRYRNTELVEALVVLLDHPERSVSQAACAGLSWVSGKPPSADGATWKKWWQDARATYVPAVARWPFTGKTELGEIRTLGGGAAGFEKIELDERGAVWAVARHEFNILASTYQLYRLDEASDQFVKVGAEVKYGNKNDESPPAGFVRRVADAKIQFPDYYQQVWVSRDGKQGAAILGQETKYYSDSVVVLDFQKGVMSRPFKTDHQYAAPVVASDGKHVAVAKGWNWANPNDVVVVECASGKERKIPIPAADNLGPLCFLDRSPKGPGFLVYRQERADDRTPGPAELWWCDSTGTQAAKLYVEAEPGSLSFRNGGDVNISGDGEKILVWRRTAPKEKEAWSFSWLHVSEGTLSPVLPAGVWSNSISGNLEGTRFVFIHESQVFEWRRAK